jgi:hypothetical protein
METPADAVRGYRWALAAVASGRIEPKVGNALGGLLSGMLGAYRTPARVADWPEFRSVWEGVAAALDPAAYPEAMRPAAEAVRDRVLAAVEGPGSPAAERERVRADVAELQASGMLPPPPDRSPTAGPS